MMSNVMQTQKPWQRSHLLTDGSEEEICHPRDDLLMEAHHARPIDPELADSILNDVIVIDVVDIMIGKMMAQK